MRCKNCGRDIQDNSLYCNWCGKYQLTEKRKTIKVPRPIQLPSGNWRIQLRREGESIVRSTPEACTKEAIRVRKQWLKDEEDGLHIEPVKIPTLSEAIDLYLNTRRSTRSISTIDGYENIQRNRFKYYIDLPVNEIDFQQMIDDEIQLGKSAKTIYNAWSLCRSALKYSKLQFDSPTLPRMMKKDRNWLDYNQIQVFLKAIYGLPCELGALLALHSLRRSELFGLRPKDYDAQKKVIHIRGAMLSVADGWIRTDLNKNDTSRRDVPVIIPRLSELLNLIDRKAEYIIGDTQKNLYREINAVCKSAGLPEPGLHGLRHSFASLAYHLGWKKLSTQQIGGWKNSKILDEIYTHNADLDADLKTMQEFFRE